MGKVQDLYDARIRPMVPAERLQLARLILDDLARSESAVDVSDEWSDDDMSEVAAYSARQGDQFTAGPSSSDEGTAGGAHNEAR